MLLSKLILTLFTTLLLSLFLRTSALVESRKVYLTKHLRLVGCKLLFAFQGKDRAGSSSRLLSCRLALCHLSLFFLLAYRLSYFCLRLLSNGFCWLLLHFFHYRSYLYRLFLLLRSVIYWLRTDGSSLCHLRSLCCLRSSRLSNRCLADTIQVNLSQWLVLLLATRLKDALGTVFLRLWCTLLLFGLLSEELFGLVANFLILTKGIAERLILLVAQLKVQFGLHLP